MMFCNNAAQSCGKRSYYETGKKRRNWEGKWVEATEQELWEADDVSLGICLKCGETEEGRCEPDATGYECNYCGAMSLCSPTMLVMAGRVKIVGGAE